MQKVIPDGLNYAAIKPEAIQNEVKIMRMVPTATVNDARPNDVIRFNLQNTGFLDPFSTYLKIIIEFPEASTLLHHDDDQAGQLVVAALDRSGHSIINRLVIRSQGTELERIDQYDVLAAMINDQIYSAEQKRLHSFEGFPQQNLTELDLQGIDAAAQGADLAEYVDNRAVIIEKQLHTQIIGGGGSTYPNLPMCAYRNPTDVPIAGRDATLVNTDGKYLVAFPAARRQIQVIIPIYSGIIGVLMGDKKLLPLSLMPLEVEFTLNPHAFVIASSTRSKPLNTRNYVVKTFEMWAHMLFFETEVHRSLESVVAQHGIFIHFNSFYQTPVTVSTGAQVTQTTPLNVHFRSINSLHWVFMDSRFLSDVSMPKLHFRNMSITSIQIRNGTMMIPSEPVQRTLAVSGAGTHSQLLVEMYKSWNKMHDVATDGGINENSWLIDDTNPTFTYANGISFTSAYNRKVDAANQSPLTKIGRCQYGMTLEGEELGMDKTIITGRQGMMPFDLLMTSGNRADPNQVWTIVFARADFVIYVRPDLVVTLLGR